jgi:hypothetical protein
LIAVNRSVTSKKYKPKAPAKAELAAPPSREPEKKRKAEVMHPAATSSQVDQKIDLGDGVYVTGRRAQEFVAYVRTLCEIAENIARRH